MAPRTREQQDAYNEKRRQANAEKLAASRKAAAPAKASPPDKPKGGKAEKVSDPKPAKGKIKAGKRSPHVPAASDPAPKVIVPRTKKLTLEDIKAIEVKRAALAAEVKATPSEPATVKAAVMATRSPRKSVTATKPEGFNPRDVRNDMHAGGGDPAPPPRKVIGSARTAPFAPLVIHEDDDVVVVAPKKVVSPPNKIVVGDGAPATHTMAKSYLRSGAPGKGKLRSGTYQCTTAFTEAQMGQVQAAATFRGVSLAEFIRSCVVTHLNPASVSTAQLSND